SPHDISLLSLHDALPISSNLYFPAVASALSIPPWSDELQEQLGIYWDPIIQVDPAQRGQFIATLAQSVLGDVLRALGLTAESLRSEEHTSELQSPCNLVC